MTKRVVVIAAGGTGGHLFPAAAFAEEMFRRDWRVVLMTDARGRRYAEGFPAERIEDVPAASLSANPITAVPAAFKIMRGINEAKKRFTELPPAIVAGFGGYPSFPALMAARAHKVPILIHEQNSVLGRVIEGNKLARTLGFPTANLDVQNEQLPPAGVYAVRAFIDGEWRASVANLGRRPTVEPDAQALSLEVHVFDLNADLYGQLIEVRFIQHLRDEVKFPGLDALKTQIARDCERAREVLA